MEHLSDEAIKHVAAYFTALSEPTRLRILNLLREQEHSVGALADRCNSSVANISRHLSLLTQRGLVRRESRGNSAFYSIADPSIYALCDLVCNSIARQLDVKARENAAFVRSVTPE